MAPMTPKQFRLPKRHIAILERAVESGEFSTESDAVRACIEEFGLKMEQKNHEATA